MSPGPRPAGAQPLPRRAEPGGVSEKRRAIPDRPGPPGGRGISLEQASGPGLRGVLPPSRSPLCILCVGPALCPWPSPYSPDQNLSFFSESGVKTMIKVSPSILSADFVNLERGYPAGFRCRLPPCGRDGRRFRSQSHHRRPGGPVHPPVHRHVPGCPSDDRKAGAVHRILCQGWGGPALYPPGGRPPHPHRPGSEGHGGVRRKKAVALRPITKAEAILPIWRSWTWCW